MTDGKTPEPVCRYPKKARRAELKPMRRLYSRDDRCPDCPSIIPNSTERFLLQIFPMVSTQTIPGEMGIPCSLNYDLVDKFLRNYGILDTSIRMWVFKQLQTIFLKMVEFKLAETKNGSASS